MRQKKLSKDTLADYFEFIEGDIPNGFKCDYDSQLFNTKPHRKTQSPYGWVSFHLAKKKNKIVLGSIHFCINKDTALSPLKAPYGSFDLSELITASQLYDFIGYVEQRLRILGAGRLTITNYPEQYHVRHHSMLSVLLFNQKFSIRKAELGACIQINETAFMGRIDSWEKRKFKQSERAGLIFKTISLKELKGTFNFILTCREERGQSLSMDYKSLSKTVNKLPENFLSFGVYNKGKLMAASIAVKANSSTLYNFYSAHSKESDSLSPVVFLLGGIYTWCQNHKIKLLDLGTSAWAGKPNFPLIDFKLRLGAEPAMKLTFEKKL